ncbi:MAG TPA: hypothetical protein VFJ57_06875 [Solirubrobacterales bacterium]|nr:hypothetical protein [Solirubrobacterales bacterium]
MHEPLGIFEWRFPDLTGFLSSKLGQILLGGVAGAFLGAAIASKLSLVALLIGALLAAGAVSAALTRPDRAFYGLVVVMVLIPSYASPGVGPILFIPAAGLAWLLAGVLAWRNGMQRGRPFTFNALDLLVAVFFILMFVSSQVSPQVEFKEYYNDVFTWLGPYLAARLLLQDCEQPARVVAIAFAVGTVLIAPVAVLETLGTKNPFFNFQFNGAESAAFGNAVSRSGEVRAQASFGHPIALSMYASASALLSLGMALYAKISKERMAWLALAAVAVAVQVMTVSRTGYVMLVIGVVLLALTTAEKTLRRQLSAIVGVVALIVLAMNLTGSGPEELQVFPSNKAETVSAEEVTESSAYREKLLERATESGVLGLWGNPYNKVTNGVSLSNTSVDNEYIILGDSWGLIPMFALIAVAVGLLVSIALALRREAFDLVILPVAALTSLCALFFVAFITQQQLMVWLLIGCASAASERTLRERRMAKRQPRRAAEAPPQPLAAIPDRL